MGFDHFSLERFEAYLDPAHCVMLSLIYGDYTELSCDGHTIFNNHVEGVGEIFSFGCGASTKGIFQFL